MNPTAFSELLADISDEYIASAAKPHSKSIRWYQISAAAACIVLLIAAAVYPKLRMQMPEVTVPPVSHAENTAVTTTETEQSGAEDSHMTASRTQSTATSETAAVNTTVDVSMTASVTATDTTVNLPKTDVVTMQPSQTDTSATATHSETLPSETTVKLTETLPETTAVSTNPVIDQPQTVVVPIWKGIIEHPEDCPEEPKPMLSGRMAVCPLDADDFLYEYYHESYGIPAEFDLTQHPCLLIVLDAYMYQDAAVISCSYSNSGLHLQIACLENTSCENSVFCYALPIPDDLILEPENCTADYLILTDETEYQALVTDSLTIELHEQEGLQ